MRGIKKVAAAAAAMAVVALLAPRAQAQVPIQDAVINGYATGSVFHLDAISGVLPAPAAGRLVNVDEAFSGASVASRGMTNQIQNEMQRVVQRISAAHKTQARGAGLEVGALLNPPSADTQIALDGRAEAFAPPSTGLITEEVGPIRVDDVVYASTLRGQAQARWLDAACILGSDLSYGLGYAEDAQLLDTGGDTNPVTLDQPLLSSDAPQSPAGGERAVAQSVSRTKLVRQTNRSGAFIGNNFGLMSEVRETIAPVTLFRGTPNQTTIEIAGEWVLRAVASGVPGGAYIHYGPGTVSPETPLIRIINAAGQVTTQLTSQGIALLGPTGLVVPLPNNVGEIVIGEDPRAIGGNASSAVTEAPDGTVASGAVDVVRVKLLETRNPAGEVVSKVEDLRIGHMEVSAQVPTGGVSCPLPVTKSANPQEVDVDQTFSTPITVMNPYDCDLTNITVTDEITTTQGGTFRVQSTNPTASQSPSGDNLSSGTIVWTDPGPIRPGDSRTYTAVIQARSAGRIEDLASVTATLANCSGESAALAGSAVGVAGASAAGGSGRVSVPVGQVLGATLARTGPVQTAAAAGGLGLIVLSGIGLYTRRRIV
ncbi:MAG TPA: hypothetical protein VNE62_04830 [Actinomycetota bacterium]|nr:hypothetical protein [Actinomycetota bacterium]